MRAVARKVPLTVTPRRNVLRWPKPMETARMVIAAVCETYGVQDNAVLGRRRNLRLAAFARQVCYFILREFDMSYDEIGENMGREHAAVIHGCNVVRRKMLHDPHTAERIYGVMDHVGLYRHRGGCHDFAAYRSGDRFGDFVVGNQKASDLCRRPGCGRRRGQHSTPPADAPRSARLPAPLKAATNKEQENQWQ